VRYPVFRCAVRGLKNNPAKLVYASIESIFPVLEGLLEDRKNQRDERAD
jgi:hypothetical protein